MNVIRSILRRNVMTSNNRAALPLVLPGVLYLLMIVVYPFILLITFAFSDKRIGIPGHWIGLSNFHYIFDSPFINICISNTLRYAVISTLASVVLGLIIALFLNSLRYRSRIPEILFVLPWVVPPTIAALISLWMFYDISGTLNWILQRLHIISNPVPWLGTNDWARIAVAVPNVWRLTPFYAICILSSRRSIPIAPYEAASLDGANHFQQFRYITLPSLKRTIYITSIFGFLWSCTEFTLIYIMTRGGPGNSTHLIGTMSYDLALRGGFEIGLGSANALLMVPISLVLAVLIWRLGAWVKRY